MVENPLQELLPPVAVISACGLLLLAQFSRYGTLIARLRLFHAELHELAARQHQFEPAARKILRDRRDNLRRQSVLVLSRARLTRGALLCLIAAVLSMVASSIALGAGWYLPLPDKHVTIALFFLGVTMMAAGVLFAAAEVWRSLSVVSEEQRQLEQHFAALGDVFPVPEREPHQSLDSAALDCGRMPRAVAGKNPRTASAARVAAS